jgi:hypothetical protein
MLSLVYDVYEGGYKYEQIHGCDGCKKTLVSMKGSLIKPIFLQQTQLYVYKSGNQLRVSTNGQAIIRLYVGNKR